MKKNKVLYTLAYILFCCLSITIQTYKNLPQSHTIWDNFYIQFFGVSSTGFSFYTYVFFCIIFLGYPIINQNLLFNVINGEVNYILIRYKSFSTFLKKELIKIILNSFFIILILFLLTTFMSLAMDLEIKNIISVKRNIEPKILIYQFLVNGFLQIINYCLILFIVICWTKKINYVLLFTGILMVLGLPTININTIFPMALNSLGYVSNDFFLIFIKTFTLLFYIIVELKIIYYLLNKRIIFS